MRRVRFEEDEEGDDEEDGGASHWPTARARGKFSRAVRSSLLLLAAFGLAGCVHYHSAPLDAGRNAAELTGARLGGRTWTVTAIEDEAARRSPEVAVAKAQYETARAAIGTAGERPNPTVAITPQFVTPKLIEGTYGVDFDWTVETAGKRARRLQTAHANARAAAARVIDAAWKARAAARQAMLELYAAEQRVKLLDEAVTRQEEVLKSWETRIQAGAESRGVAAQPRLLQTQLRLQAADAARAASLARVSLASALGMSAAAVAQAKFSFSAFERGPGAVRHRYSALTHRGDVLAALADYASSEGALRLEVAKQYPDVHLNPGYQLDAGQNKWGVGIGLTLPILNQNRGAIGEAEGRRREMAAKFNAVQAKALNEVDRAAASLAASRAKLAVAEQLLGQQTKQVEMEERRLAAGDEDRLALLSAKVERVTILLGRLDAQVEVQAALGALEAATQTEVDK